MPEKVLVKKPGAEPSVERLDRVTYEWLSEAVGGYIEVVPVGPGVYIVLNEDGMAKNLPDNCGLLGTFVFIGMRPEEVEHEDLDVADEFCGLGEDDLGRAAEWCRRREGAKHPRRGFEVVSGDEAFDALIKIKLDRLDQLNQWRRL